VTFDLLKSYEIWERTPFVLRALLHGLGNDWIKQNEGPDTFSPFDVVGHLIHGEKTDWPSRIRQILEKETTSPFVPYDRFAMYQESSGKNLDQLLDEFENLRMTNIKWVRSLNLSDTDLNKKGLHPRLGEVTLRQLLSTWVIHDLTHLSQITRVMAKQYKEEMGPWLTYFRIMNF
jgi:hypothetical protein